MDQEMLFALALGLGEPWYVTQVGFDPEQKELEIWIDFRRGAVFACSQCGASGCKGYDTDERSWRHLNFFEHRSTLRARVPRVSCPQCGPRPVGVPWARPGSGFTLLFEALALTMASAMPVKAVARIMGEHDTRLWRVITHYVDEARAKRSDAEVKRIAVDETASRRGHNYVSLVMDLDRRCVLFATEGKDASVLERFRKDLEAHGGSAKRIIEACCDMSEAFISGLGEQFPQAPITFDKFHVAKLISAAVEKTRREEQKTTPELKGMRHVILRNRETMSEAQEEKLNVFLATSRSKTARAVLLRLLFTDLWKQSKEEAATYLKRWCSRAQRSRIRAMVEAGRSVRAHWDGILRWFTSGITNGLLEGINSLVQAAKAKARGYRSNQNLITIIYLIAGKLNLPSTHLS